MQAFSSTSDTHGISCGISFTLLADFAPLRFSIRRINFSLAETEQPAGNTSVNFIIIALAVLISGPGLFFCWRRRSIRDTETTIRRESVCAFCSEQYRRTICENSFDVEISKSTYSHSFDFLYYLGAEKFSEFLVPDDLANLYKKVAVVKFIMAVQNTIDD